jgi:hypothetical protein
MALIEPELGLARIEGDGGTAGVDLKANGVLSRLPDVDD